MVNENTVNSGMTLGERPAEQLKGHIEWLRGVVENNSLAQARWETLKLDLAEHALFLESFVLPKVMELKEPTGFVPSVFPSASPPRVATLEENK